MVAHGLLTYDIGKIVIELEQLLNHTCEDKRFLQSVLFQRVSNNLTQNRTRFDPVEISSQKYQINLTIAFSIIC